MRLLNDCLECINVFEDKVFVSGHVTRVTKCEYGHSAFPTARSCRDYRPEVVSSNGRDVGDEVSI